MAKQAKFTVYEKLSKKQQREIDRAGRGSWGLVKPVTRVKPSGKVYKRAKAKQVVQAYSRAGAACFFARQAPGGICTNSLIFLEF